jgi:ribosomal protein L7/L12
MPIESLECPNCGAALHVYDSDSVVTCSYCNSTVRLTGATGARTGVLDTGAAVDASDAPFVAELRDLLQRGNKIEAIKRYRQRTSLGLKEAKDEIEAFERDQNNPAVLVALRRSPAANAAPVHHAPLGEADAQAVADQIKALLARDQKIQAIKLLREKSDLNLLDAKNAVEALERDPNDTTAFDAMRRGPAAAGMAIPSGVDIARIQLMLKNGEPHIQAVRLYAQQAGVDMAAAAEAVYAIDQAQRFPDASAPAGGSTWTPPIPGHPITHPAGRGVPWVALIYGVFALLVLGSGIYQLYLSLQQNSWPAANGVITDSWNCTKTVNGDEVFSGACVGYQYTVGGRPYEWHAEDDPGQDYYKSFLWNIFGIPDKYAKGREVEVYYNPADPKESVLEPGVNPANILHLLFGLLLAGVPLVLALRARATG